MKKTTSNLCRQHRDLVRHPCTENRLRNQVSLEIVRFGPSGRFSDVFQLDRSLLFFQVPAPSRSSNFSCVVMLPVLNPFATT